MSGGPNPPFFASNSSLSGGLGNPPQIWRSADPQPLSTAAAAINQSQAGTPPRQQQPPFADPANRVGTFNLLEAQYPGQFSAFQNTVPPPPHPTPGGRHHRTLSSEAAGPAVEVQVLSEVPSIFDFVTTPALAEQTSRGTSNLTSTHFALASVASPRFPDNQYPPGSDFDFTPGTSRVLGYTSQTRIPANDSQAAGTSHQGDPYASIGMVSGHPTNPVTSSLYGRPGTYMPTPSDIDGGQVGQESNDDTDTEDLMKMVLDDLYAQSSLKLRFTPPSIRLPPLFFPAMDCQLMSDYATAYHGNYAIGLILGFFGDTNAKGLGLLTLDRPDQGLSQRIAESKNTLKNIVVSPANKTKYRPEPLGPEPLSPEPRFLEYYTGNLFQSLVEEYVIPPMADAYEHMYAKPLLEGIFTFAIEKVLKNPDLLPFANFDVPTENIMFKNAARLVATHTLDIHAFASVPASTLRTSGRSGRSPLNTRINFMNPSSSANIADAMQIARLFAQRKRLLDARLPMSTEKSPHAWKTEDGVLVMRFSDDVGDRNEVYILHFQSPCVIAITRWLIAHINGDFPETVAAFIEDQVAIGKARFPTGTSNADTTQPPVDPKNDGDLVWHVAKTAVAVRLLEIGAVLYMADEEGSVDFTADDIIKNQAAMNIFYTRLLSAETALWKLKTEHEGEYRILRANILELMITTTQSLAPGFIQDLNLVCRPEDSTHLSPGPESHHQGQALNARFVPFSGIEQGVPNLVMDRERLRRLHLNQHEARTVLRDTIPYHWTTIGKPKEFHSHPGLAGREVVAVDPSLEDGAQRALVETQIALAHA
ncbi:hypothetical protein DFP72DRAFT_840300 [Ephemerocybe angulata]|uniref:Uncharacterized protein n=1 Tax=Ephemerocybe angulata TaxID=980116 RepID=A0A8H6MCI4_9AGAR|nr:hypothetical protein DFP72DRAFT_840300 [Tulosesus angulatus]